MDFVRDIGAVWPLALLGLPCAVTFALLLVWRLSVRDARRTSLGVPRRSGRVAALFSALTPTLLLILAVSRPYVGRETLEVPSANADYMFIVDVSRSMLAKDIPPSRMELARRKMKDIVRAFAREDVATRVGITVFAGGVYTICPLTDDSAAVLQFIDQISPDLVTSVGSNLERAVATVLERIKASGARSPRMLLISDGEDNMLNVEQVVGLLRSAKVPLDVLGVGTPLGSPIELPDGRYVRDKSGSIVHSRLNEQSLQLIAAAGDGKYVRATISDKDVDELVEAATPMLRVASGENKRSVTNYREVGSWFALAALLFMIALVVMHRDGVALTALMLALLSARPLYAEPTPTPLPLEVSGRAAFELYHSGQYEQAASVFAQALTLDPSNRALEQGLASALFKTQQFSRAQEIFRKLADSAEDGRSYFENTYNEGNSFLAMRRFQDAIDAYSKALDVKPEDDMALHNRALARRLLEESKRATPTNTPTHTPPQSPSAAPSPSAVPSPSPEPSPSSAPSPSAALSPSVEPSPSRQPSANPSAQPSSQPSPSDSGQASPSPGATAAPTSGSTPNTSSSPATPGTPTVESTTSASAGTPESGTPEPSERRKEAVEQATTTPFSGGAAARPTAQSLDPSLREAETWLKSLPEAPLLLRRDKSRRESSEQTW